MALTIDKVKDYYLPKNVSRANNYNDYRTQLAVYNDSVSLYQAIKLVFDDEVTLSGTNLTNTPAATTILLESSTGTDTTLPAATTSLAGVMTSTDKVALNSLVTLSGVLSGATNLGAFTGSIISDNTTIKNALQELEDAIEDGSGLPLGNLSSTTSAITVASGTNAVFVPTGVTLTLVPANIALSGLGGSLNLSQLNTSGATSGDYISYNGSA